MAVASIDFGPKFGCADVFEPKINFSFLMQRTGMFPIKIKVSGE
jgi:hypothetical protein